MVVTGGNVNDTTMMTAVLEDIRVPPRREGPAEDSSGPGARRQGVPVEGEPGLAA